MIISRKFKKYILLIIPIIIFLVSCPLVITNAAAITTSINYEVPIYKIPITGNTQREIWTLCEKKDLSYELALAVFLVEGEDNNQIDNVKVEIEKLVYYRDYWTKQGFPDELVFDLMLLSEEKGIEGCKIMIKASDYSYWQDSYVQKVTGYKYYLEQSNSANVSM